MAGRLQAEPPRKGARRCGFRGQASPPRISRKPGKARTAMAAGQPAPNLLWDHFAPPSMPPKDHVEGDEAGADKDADAAAWRERGLLSSSRPHPLDGVGSARKICCASILSVSSFCASSCCSAVRSCARKFAVSSACAWSLAFMRSRDVSW
jgi:hypothetical protein